MKKTNNESKIISQLNKKELTKERKRLIRKILTFVYFMLLF